MESGEACGARGFDRNGAEAEVRGELSSAAMATAGGAFGTGRSWAQLSREEGRSEIELGFDDGLGGGGKERHGDTWAQTPRRRRRPRRVEQSSDGGACRARELPEGRGFGKPVGARGRFGWGRDACGGRMSTPAARRRRRERETEEKGDGGEGNFVIKAKFKISFCKLNFSHYSKGQMKNF